jgi:hypothetical protein
MFGHQNVTGNDKSAILPDLFQRALEEAIAFALGQQRFSPVALKVMK